MKVLVVGSGGREHAIVWRLSQSASVSEIFAAPGNPGTVRIAKNVAIKVDDIDGLLQFAQSARIDLTVVGPELPLSLGIVDAFRAAGLRIFGPIQACAQLEASKDFAKEVMVAAKVPTAAYHTYHSRDALLKALSSHQGPIVLKADGLAAGKGVYVCKSREEALAAVDPLFGELKADKVVAEEFLDGVEASFIVATDGKRIVPLAPAHDYKRIFDNDQGPNTGGMGTVSPTPRLSEEQSEWTVANVIQPVLSEMERRGSSFSGFLYAGLMILKSGEIKVLEFNARLGDPETQVIMRRLESDLGQLLFSLAAVSSEQQSAPLPDVTWSSQSAVCVVLAAHGYPGTVRNGDEITGLNLIDSLPGVVVFHAGTNSGESGRILTAGGRVLGVTALAPSLADARRLVYKGADMLQFRGVQLRRDIGIS